MSTITKKKLVNRIAERLSIKQQVSMRIIQTFLDEITDTLAAGNKIEFREFGVFQVYTRKTRIAQNPRTLEKVTIPNRKVVKFKPGKIMKAKVLLVRKNDAHGGNP